MKFAILFFCLVAGSQAFSVHYDGYKVFRVVPENEQQQRVLHMLEKSEQFDFWMESRMQNHPAHIMVEPSMIEDFKAVMELNKIKYSVYIEDVEKLVQQSADDVNLSREGRISFTQYNKYDTVAAYLKNLAMSHPDTVTLFSIGKSYEGRDILCVRISKDGNDKPGILVDAGIHAREWMAQAQAQYMIQELAENPANANLIADVAWYIIPILNPDGYEYSHSYDRMWRKTRSQGKRCYGVDPNRNFGFHWNEVGTSNDECSDIYSGPKAFSESETSALRDYVVSYQGKFQLYVTFHSFGEWLLYPWGWTSALPDNVQELDDLAHDVNDAIRAVRGTNYVIGTSTNVLYPAAGGSDDYMMAIAGIPLAYTLELPSRGGGFAPPASEIKGVVAETFEGMKVYGKYIANKYRNV